MRSISPTVTSVAPPMSTPAAIPDPSFSSMMSDGQGERATPTGQLMKKIQCQLSAWVRIPPRRSPTEPPPIATTM